MLKLIFPDATHLNIDWQHKPAIHEDVLFEKNTYTVANIVHEVDNSLKQVVLIYLVERKIE